MRFRPIVDIGLYFTFVWCGICEVVLRVIQHTSLKQASVFKYLEDFAQCYHDFDHAPDMCSKFACHLCNYRLQFDRGLIMPTGACGT
jgi:hypothetical protein